ncbi:DUF3228 family protein [Vampirovibrio chlorellavorus]|uniref:DUF3228 family protein n=1 Tax=Vampirovibrio chlorellavorus TaxID=758823 RepID=UPI0026EDCE2F|nr:DUF3228 family protein [Vampirovibrio chlorellavorus]
MALIGVSDFVKRQTPDSKDDHFAGNWDELVNLVERQWEQRQPSPHNSGVLLIPMPEAECHRFLGSVIAVDENTPLTAHFAPRMAGEAGFIQVEVCGGQKAPAHRAEIILYSHETLAQDGDAPATREADYYIISINAYASGQAEPMSPMTMARNFLGLKGGTRPETPYTAQEFAESIIYWSQHARIGQASPGG